MNKAELISAIAEESNITKADSKLALDAILKITGETLKKGEKVTLVGFGTFSVSERNERKGRNPQTGAEITIPAKKIPSFKAGADLKNMIR